MPLTDVTSVDVEEGSDRPRTGAAPSRPSVSVKHRVGAEPARAAYFSNKRQEGLSRLAQGEALAAQALAEGKASQEQAQKLQQWSDGVRQLEDEALQASMRNAQNVQKLGAMVGSFRPRPGRLFQDGSAAAMWGAAMSLAASTFQSSRSGGANGAMQIIQTAIQQDLAAQELQYDAKKSELQSAQTLYTQMRASYGDAIVARQAQRAALLEAAKMRVTAAGAPAAGAAAMAEKAALNYQLNAEGNESLIEMAEKEYTITSYARAKDLGPALLKLLPRELQMQLLENSGSADLATLYGISSKAAQQLLEQAQMSQERGNALKSAVDAEAKRMDAEEQTEQRRQRAAASSGAGGGTRRGQGAGSPPTRATEPAETTIEAEVTETEATPEGDVTSTAIESTVEETPAGSSEMNRAQTVATNQEALSGMQKERADLEGQVAYDAQQAELKGTDNILEAAANPQGLSDANLDRAIESLSGSISRRRGPLVGTDDRVVALKALEEEKGRRVPIVDRIEELKRQEYDLQQETDALGAEVEKEQRAAAQQQREAQAAEGQRQLEASFARDDAMVAQAGESANVVRSNLQSVMATPGKTADARVNDARFRELAAENEQGDLVSYDLMSALPRGGELGTSWTDPVMPGAPAARGERKIRNQTNFLRALGGTVNIDRNTAQGQRLWERFTTLGTRGSLRGAERLTKNGQEAKRTAKPVDQSQIPVAFVRDINADGSVERFPQKLREQLGAAGMKGVELVAGWMPQTVMAPKYVRMTGEGVDNGGIMQQGEEQVTIMVPVWINPALMKKAVIEGGDYQFGDTSEGAGQDVLRGGKRNFRPGLEQKEKQEYRAQSERVKKLKPWVTKLMMFSGLRSTTGQAFGEGAQGGVDLDLGEVQQGIQRAIENADGGPLTRLSPAQKNDLRRVAEGGDPRDSELLRGLLSRDEDGNYFLTSNGLESGKGTVSHFYGFMAPQKAELEIVERSTGMKRSDWYSPIGWAERLNQTEAMSSSLAFRDDLQDKLTAMYDTYTMGAPTGQAVYKATLKAMSNENTTPNINSILRGEL